MLSKKKAMNWAAPSMETLGYWLDTEDGTIGIPERKVEQIRSMLREWPEGRREATVGEVLSLTGKLHNAAFVVRLTRYHVRRLLQLTNFKSASEWEREGGRWRGLGTA